jgi:hypothetical protein
MNRRQFLQTTGLAAAAMPFVSSAFASSARAIRAEQDGMLRVRGQREFILGLYQVPKREGALREASVAGFNLINRGATRAAYDEAQSLGLWGWSALGSLPSTDRSEAENRMRQIIQTLRDHPALLFWETEDEPTFAWKEPTRLRTSAAQINDTAAFIRKLDATHPLYLNQSPTNLVSTLQAYNPAADIVATDLYPVIPRGMREEYALWPDGRQGDFLNETVSQVGQYADKMRAVAGASRAVFMVLQGFAWEMLREKDRDPAMVLYPTAAQLRFMAWQAVVHGVNGLIWWGLSFTPEGPLWDDLRTVVRQLAQVRAALAAPSVQLPLKLSYHDTGHSLDRGVEWIAKPLARETLLIAVNADGNPVEVTFHGLNRFRKCEPMFESRSVEWAQGQWRERFEPFGTRVWRLGAS